MGSAPCRDGSANGTNGSHGNKWRCPLFNANGLAFSIVVAVTVLNEPLGPLVLPWIERTTNGARAANKRYVQST